MDDTTIQMRTLIHHILHRHNIYKLNLNQLSQVLSLLKEEPTEQPSEIQEKIFKGIIKFNQHYKDHVSSVLSENEFQAIPFQIKSMMHKVLHQYYFLNAIKAWEMFSPHFQQPANHSQSNINNSTKSLLDDQLEKARLHYLYYGPMSTYHFNQQLPQLPQQPPMGHYPPLFGLQRDDRFFQNDHPRPARGRPPLNKPKNFTLQGFSSYNYKQRVKQELGLLPKKRMTEKQFSDSLVPPEQERNNDNKMQAEQPHEQKQMKMDQCLCKGAVKSQNFFQCKCKKLFHQECVGSETQCLACRQAEYDPFNQVVWQVGSFAVNFDESNLFQGYLNMYNHGNIFSIPQYGVVASCAHPSFQGLCWPDDILFKINDQNIFQIPALLKAHNQNRRKDKQIIITPYLSLLSQNPTILHRIKFSLEVTQPAGDTYRRNNRKGTFQLCFFIIKHVSSDDIFFKIVDDYSKRPKIGPYDWNFYEVEPDRMAVTIFDPYSHELIDCPARGTKCMHLQCFDLRTFLIVNEASPFRDWLCPICQKSARQLLIDKYQLLMLKDLKARNSIPKKIIFFKSGVVEYQRQQVSESEGESGQKD